MHTIIRRSFKMRITEYTIDATFYKAGRESTDAICRSEGEILQQCMHMETEGH